MKKREIKKSSLRGQVNISFGMIFSVILIVFFLVFAFYAINTFLGFTDNAKAGKFYTDFQSDISNVWSNSVFSSQNFNYSVPSYVNLVCIADFNSEGRGSNSAIYTELKTAYTGKENIVFYPVKFTGYESKELNYLNMSAIVSQENPFCINASNGQVSLVLKKDYGQALVTVTRQ